MIFKTKLLLASTFIFHLSGNVAAIGGYDRQALALISKQLLQQFYIEHPLIINLPNLPINLLEESPEFQLYNPILTIFVEEGVLTKTSKVMEQDSHETSVNESSIQLVFSAKRLMTFDFKPGHEAEIIDLGRIVISRIIQVNENNTEYLAIHPKSNEESAADANSNNIGNTREDGGFPLRIVFEWQLFDSPDWLWAVSLDDHPIVAFYRSANSTIKTGVAYLNSVDETWVITKSPNLLIELIK